jgi:hypothetical protein
MKKEKFRELDIETIKNSQNPDPLDMLIKTMVKDEVERKDRVEKFLKKIIQ